MKRLLMLLMVAMMLAACSKKEIERDIEIEQSKQEQDDYEVLSEKEYEVELYDSDDLNVALKKSRHERDSVQDWMKLMFTFKNKTDKTHEFYFEEITLDGNTYKVTSISSTDTEIKPNEELEVIVVVDSLEEISFDEFIAGQLIYIDYEKNRNKAEFSSYINE